MSRKASAAVKTALALLGLGTVLFFLVSRPAGRKESGLRPAAPLELESLSGKPVSLESFRGKVVLLDFWATWCEPCLEELPDLVNLHRKYADKGFALVGVSMDAEGRRVVEPFVKRHAIPYPILLAHGDAPRGWLLPGLPTAYLISRDQKIVRRYLGPKSYDELVRDVEELLGR